VVAKGIGDSLSAISLQEEVMVYNYSETLNPQKALIWRIVHRANIPWILDNGLHAVTVRLNPLIGCISVTPS
jgi:hypothetical protein